MSYVAVTLIDGRHVVENRQTREIVSVKPTYAEAELEAANRCSGDAFARRSRDETRRILGHDYDPAD